MRIIVLGPPGAGKGTQAVILSEHFNIPHISSGDLFRYHISHQTELGEVAKSFIDKGDLVPSSVTISMINARLSELDAANGFILDGYPRAKDQAIALQEFLALLDEVQYDVHQPDQGLDAVLSFVISDVEIIKRLEQRGRADDQGDVIKNRLHVYYEQTEPLIQFYGAAIKQIDAVGSTEEVSRRVLKLFDKN